MVSDYRKIVNDILITVQYGQTKIYKNRTKINIIWEIKIDSFRNKIYYSVATNKDPIREILGLNVQKAEFLDFLGTNYPEDFELFMFHPELFEGKFNE